MKETYTFSVDRKLVIRSWNSNMEKLCCKESKDVLNTKVDEVFPLLKEKITPVFSNKRKKTVKNYRGNCFKGGSLTTDIEMVPVRNRKKEVSEVSVIFRNIRGECPLERRLADSEKMIAIGKMASSLAHGVRNPLNSIKGAVAYLKGMYGHEATLLEFSTIIDEEINKLDAFISSFLSTAKGDMKFDNIDLTDIIRSIIVMIKPRAEIQDIEILEEFSSMPVIQADAFQVEQALFNIINNAMEAMPQGGDIRIKTGLKWEKGVDYAVIEISDSGKGIPEDKLKYLGELSDNPEKKDRGFGIFLSREVIKSHNGQLLWESIRDRGTIFKILLPVHQSEPG